jgi:acetolactate synthase-1/2/3 large subunit
MPMIMITGQKGVLSRKQARFQVVDMVTTMTPLTKMAQQIVSPATIPSIVREAFRVAQEERPGPVHMELPEDIAAAPAPSIAPVPPHSIDRPVASREALDRAAALILKAERPLIMLGAAANRPHLAEPLSDFVRRLQIPFFNTQMGKGAVAGGSGLYMGTAAVTERDYVHWAIDRADLVIAIGHDTVEKPPFLMGPDGPTVLHVGYSRRRSRRSTSRMRSSWAMSAPALACWRTVSTAGRRTRARSLSCARRSSPALPAGRKRAAIPRRRSASCTTCGR